MNRFIAAILLAFATQISYAQTELDGMSLRGLAIYQQLRTDYYVGAELLICLLYTSPSPRDQRGSRMPSSA